ncbi:ankyrin repeat-containing domain protein [Mycena rebaudengoi]|nr:ankyrin repeat-containing domain protein [Mycena rebaudengoi]
MALPPDHFEQLAPELILLLPSSLSTASLNSLILTCRRLWEVLQPELEARITPALARQILPWAAASKPHIIKKLLSPPYSVHPSATYGRTPLHIAAGARNVEIATLLLQAGADPNAEYDQDELRPLHEAVQARDLKMVTLLLDHGAHIDAHCGCDGVSENALHTSCANGDLEIVDLLLVRGAQIERRGHYGGALGFAVHYKQFDIVKRLLAKGADATVVVPLYVLLEGGPPPPLSAELLYLAMGLRAPTSKRERERQLMALLLAHGTSKDATLARISKYLKALADEVERTEEEFLQVVQEMIKEAEDAVPEIIASRTDSSS